MGGAMMRRIAFLVGAIALLGGVIVPFVDAEGTSESRSPKRIIKVQQVPKSFVSTNVDVAPKGFGAGDYYVFHIRLQNLKGVPIGLTDGQCTVIFIEHKTTRYQCLVIETLQRGTIIHDGIFIPNTVSRFTVIGGTGDYFGVGGEAIYQAPNLEFRLTN
jgi:hypothetical protein